jgi:hypothetical protein
VVFYRNHVRALEMNGREEANAHAEGLSHICVFPFQAHDESQPVEPSLCSKLNNMEILGCLFVSPAILLQVDQHVTKTIKVTTSDGLPVVRERLQ